jgi:Kef-type K+ transport system membrane component KefB
VFSASEILAGDSSHEPGRCRITCFIAAVFCSYRIENEARSLSGTRIWLWAGFVILLAIAGKMGGAIVAARWTGYDWRSSLGLAALLNTRGLVELIVLNIAYNAHVFSPELFTMLVIMALVTTMMTVPILNWLKIGKGRKRSKDLALPTAA